MNRRGLLGLGAASAAGLVTGCTTSGSGSAPPAPAASSTPSPTPSTSPTQPVLDDAVRAELDALLTEQRAATGLPGLAGVVRIGDEVWEGATGVGDLKTGSAYPPSAFVRIASITKTFTATAVLQLVDRGKIDLDAPLENYVPGVINGKVATIEDLLAMRSGIPDFTANKQFVARFDREPNMRWSDRDTLDVIAEAKKPDFAPGEKVVYCDSNYFLLGLVMRKVTGQAAGETITEQIVKPLQLTKTSYPTDASVPDPHPTPYLPTKITEKGAFDNDASPPRTVNKVNPNVPSTAGAMISTLGDLQTWGTELVTGTLLKPATQALRLKTRRFTGQQLDFGYGLGITNLSEFLGHDGAILGYSSVVFTRPQTRTQIAFVANESNNFTTPTLTAAVAVIQKLYPDQLS